MPAVSRRTFLLTPGLLGAGVPMAAANGRRATLDHPAPLQVTKTPGLAAQRVIGGTPFLRVGGVREAGRPEPMTADSVFSAASLTKPVFAMEVRRLVREGKLEWRRPLQEFVALGLTG